LRAIQSGEVSAFKNSFSDDCHPYRKQPLPTVFARPVAPNTRSLQTPASTVGDSEARLIAMYGLDFGDVQQVKGPRGTTYVREAAPTEQFWNAWRQSKDTVKAAGFSLRKHHDEWSVGYWSDDEDCPLPEHPV
jgi:hypothetical protein